MGDQPQEVPVILARSDAISLSDAMWQFLHSLAAPSSGDLEKSPPVAPDKVALIDMLTGDREF